MRRAVAGLALALLFATAAAADSVRSEGVGTAPLPGAPGEAPRTVALDAALADAVRRVAVELMGESSSPGAEAALRDALGSDPGRFVQSYRSVSESERPQAGAPGREAVVTIEAQVDRVRLAAALRRAGLLAAQAVPPPDVAARIVVEPLPSWPDLAALRRRLLELGADRAELERVEPGRAVLAIESDKTVASLVSAVVAAPPPGVSVSRGTDLDGAPRVRLDSVARRADGGPPPIDTPAAKR